MLATITAANSIGKRMQADPELKGFGPLIILTIIEVIIKIVRFYEECPVHLHSPKETFHRGGVLIEDRIKRATLQILRNKKQDLGIADTMVMSIKAELHSMDDAAIAAIINEHTLSA